MSGNKNAVQRPVIPCRRQGGRRASAAAPLRTGCEKPRQAKAGSVNRPLRRRAKPAVASAGRCPTGDAAGSGAGGRERPPLRVTEGVGPRPPEIRGGVFNAPAPATPPIVDREALLMELLPTIARRAKWEVGRGCPIPAEDLAQAAALQIWKSLPGFDPGRGCGALAAWAGKRIVGAMKEHMRQHGLMLHGGRRIGRTEKIFDVHARRDNGNLYYDYEDPGAARAAREAAAAESFDDLLRGLTKFQRLIVLLRFRDGKEQKEIAALLGVCESRISQILLGLLARLKPALAGRIA